MTSENELGQLINTVVAARKELDAAAKAWRDDMNIYNAQWYDAAQEDFKAVALDLAHATADRNLVEEIVTARNELRAAAKAWRESMKNGSDAAQAYEAWRDSESDSVAQAHTDARERFEKMALDLAHVTANMVTGVVYIPLENQTNPT